MQTQRIAACYQTGIMPTFISQLQNFTVHWFSLVGTHYAYPRRNVLAELTWLAVHILIYTEDRKM